MEEYKKVSNLSESIMIRDLREAINKENKKEEYKQSGVKNNKPTCVFCGNEENVLKYKGKFICRKCYEELINMNSDLKD